MSRRKDLHPPTKVVLCHPQAEARGDHDGGLARTCPLGLLGLLLGCVLALGACSHSPSAPGMSDDYGGTTATRQDGGQWVVDSHCTPGQVAACSIELGTHDGQIDCALGEKTCEALDTWSRCFLDASKGTKSIPMPSPAVGAGIAGPQSIGGSSAMCVNDPCNPY